MTIRWLPPLAALLALSAAELRAEPVAGDAEAGATLYADACVACHGRTGRGLGSFPSVRGRDADYVADRLTRYRAGERLGPNAMLMIPMAEDLSDQDIADLAAHIGSAFR
ncbi:MAG: c-type cytochrome [Rubrimonas sp.]